MILKWSEGTVSLAPMVTSGYCHLLVQGSPLAVRGLEAIKWENPGAPWTGLHSSFCSHTMLASTLPFSNLLGSAYTKHGLRAGSWRLLQRTLCNWEIFLSREFISTLQVLPAESCTSLQCAITIYVITIPSDPVHGQRQRSDLPLVGNVSGK